MPENTYTFLVGFVFPVVPTPFTRSGENKKTNEFFRSLLNIDGEACMKLSLAELRYAASLKASPKTIKIFTLNPPRAHHELVSQTTGIVSPSLVNEACRGGNLHT